MLSHLTKAYRRRAFADPALELEFLELFRTAGVRFLCIGAVVGAGAFLAFFLIDFLNGKSVTTSPQPLRLLIGAFLAGIACVCWRLRTFALQHYSWLGSGTVVCTVVVNFLINFGSRLGDPPAVIYWSLSSSAIIITLIIYGFSRVRTMLAVGLSLFTAGVALFFATQVPPDVRLLNRMLVHVIAANVVCFTLQQVILYRERKLFLQSKRRRNVAELRRAKDRAEKADQAKSAFLANMSHEIRTPMNGVLGTLSLIDESQLSGRNRELIQTARHSAGMLLQVLNEILDFAKIDANHLNLRSLPFSPAGMVESACQVFQASAAAKSIALVVQIEETCRDLSVIGDEEKLRRVLLNLIGNAVKFTHAGQVQVGFGAVATSEGYLLNFTVADSGIGIPADKIDNLFQPFYQVESGTSRSYGGSGLGLAICKRIVESMNGRITVQSELGAGSIFHVKLALRAAPTVLPVVTQAAPAAAVRTEDAPPLPAALQGHVLLVEDNAVNAFISAAMLQSIGLTSTHAENGQQAVDLFRDGAFDLVMMDCEMPVMDGYDATRQMREVEARANRRRTPIVAVTAHALTGDREHCLTEGMDDYLSKPLERQQMLSLLARWLPPEPAGVPDDHGAATPAAAASASSSDAAAPVGPNPPTVPNALA